ncbi:MAG TPA: LpqB family beta-propeller domain-containing protein [Actinocrinis sp.]|jgi:hypothetical protein
MTKRPGGPAAARRRSSLLAALCALLACAAAGCGNLIPGASPVTTYTSQATSNSDNDVRVWPPEPTKGESPSQIIDGFLLSSASGPADAEIAEDYLAGSAKTSWSGSEKIYIYDGLPQIQQAASGEFAMTLGVVATVSTAGVYAPTTPAPQSQVFDFKLAQTADGYRIEQLPNSFGMAMDPEQFRSNYAPYSVFFDSPLDGTQPSMIPVQYYVPSGDTDQATATQLAGDMVGGPPDWISAVALVAAGVEGDNQPQVSIDQNGVAHVVLGGAVDCTDNACARLADELRVSFAGLGSVSGVQLYSKQNKLLATAQSIGAIESRYGIKLPGHASAAPAVYYLDPTGRVERDAVQNGAVTFQPATVQVAPAGVKLGQLEVGADGPVVQIAAVNTAGTELYVAQAGAAPSAGPAFTATSISSLTWDDFGDLWFIATVDGDQSLYRLAAQQTVPEVVPVDPALNATIEQIAVAPDGRRLAVLTGSGSAGSATDLSVGEFFGDGVDWSERLVSAWNSIADVVWADSRSLAVLGTQTGTSSPTIYEYYSDGSPVVDANLNAETITPPGGTSRITWADGSTNLLLAQCSSCTDGQGGATPSAGATGDGQPGSGQQQFIEQYQPSGGTWIGSLPGESPAIAG